MDRSDNSLTRRALLFGRQAARDETGATALSYALLAAIIAIPMIPALNTIGYLTSEKYRCTTRVINDRKIGGKCKRALFQK